MIPNLVTVVYLALAIRIGFAYEYQQAWAWIVIAAVFLAEAALLRLFSNRENFLSRWRLLIFVQFPFFLCILLNRFWPVVDTNRLFICILLLCVSFWIYCLRRRITEETLIRLVFATLPAFIVLIQGSHFGLIQTSNEWRLMAEEGQIMGWVTKVMHGEVPYRDAIVTRGPTIIYSTAAVLNLFGESLLIKRVWFAIFNLLMAYAGYYFCKIYISSKPLRWFTFILMMLIHDFTYRTGFALLALALFSVSISKQSVRWAAACGASAALALLSSVEAGAAAGVTLAVSSIAGYVFRADHKSLYKRVTAGWIAGTVLVLGPLMLILALRGEFIQVLESVLVYPKYAMLGYAASPYPNLLKIIQADVGFENYLFPYTRRIFILWYLPVLIYLFTFFLVIRWIYLRKMNEKELMILTAALFGWLLYHSALGRTDFHHLYFCVSPAFALLAIHADRLLNARKRDETHLRAAESLQESSRAGNDAGVTLGNNSFSRFLTVSLAVLAPILFILQRPSDHLVPFSLNILQNLRGDSSLSSDLEPFAIQRMQGILGQRTLRRRVESTVSAIQSRLRPGDRIYAFPNLPLYYFLLDSPNPTRFEWAYQAITHEMRLEVVTDLKERKPKFIIYSMDPRQRLDRIPLNEAVPEIVEFLDQYYKPWAVFGREQIWIPKNLNLRSPRPLPEVKSESDDSVSRDEDRDE